jgi:hypothetical protein
VLHETELVIQIVEKLSVKLMKTSDQKYIVNRNVRNLKTSLALNLTRCCNDLYDLDFDASEKMKLSQLRKST